MTGDQLEVPADGDRLRRSAAVRRIAVAALLAFHAALGWAARPIGIQTHHDDAKYVLLAQALRHGSYAESWDVAHSTHTLYPPGYPMVLAAWGALFGEGYDALAALSVLASTLALALTYVAAARAFSAGVALGTLAVLAPNPYLIHAAGLVMSEPIYTVWSVGGLLLLLGVPHQWRRLAAAASLAILAALTRSVGLTLVLALGAHLLLARRFRAFTVFALACALTVGAWSAWTALAPEQTVGGTYVADAMTEGRHSAAPFAAILLRRFTAACVDYFAITLPYRLPVPTVTGTRLDNVLSSALVLAGLAAGLWLAWRRWRVAVLYGAAYVGLLCAWPWVSGRFLHPLLPIATACILAGWGWLGSRLGPRVGTLAVAVPALVLAVNGLWRVGPYLERRVACRHEPAPPAASSCLVQSQLDYFAAARYARDSLPRNSVVMVENSATFFYYTGLRSPHYSVASTPDTLRFVERLRASGAGFILLSGLTSADRDRVGSLVEAWCRSLRVEARFPPPALLVRVPPNSDHDTANACRAVAEYRNANAGATFAVLGISPPH